MSHAEAESAGNAAVPGAHPLGADGLLALVTEMLSISGPSGEEVEIAAYVEDQLRAAGAPADAIYDDRAHERIGAGRRGNLIVKLPGTRVAPRRLLTAHLDTVPLCVGAAPERNGEFIRSANAASGLGADNRAGAAAILAAALAVLRHGLPHPPLTFCWFVQEEVGLQGARCLEHAALGSPERAFNWDGGSAAKLTVGATGGYRLGITVRGKAAHAGGAPEQGVSAIAIAALAIADLQRSGWHGLIRKAEGDGTSNFGVIQGGAATNVVTEEVRLRAEARSHSPAFRAQIVSQIEGAFRRAAQEVVNVAGECGEVLFAGRLDYDSFRLADDDSSVLAAEAAVRAIGRAPQRAVSNGGLDANWLTSHGIPSVTLGCGQLHVHTRDELLDVREYLDACAIALRLATET